MVTDENKIMTAEKCLEIITDLEDLGVETFLDGGWGTDALLGEQTRPHGDIDFYLDKKNVEVVKQYFFDKGFKETDEETNWWHFILEGSDAIIDIHVVELIETGEAYYGPRENNAIFPAYAFEGRGKINGVEVKCLSAEYRVVCLTVAYGVVTRTGFQMKDTDYEDIAAICKKYNIELPVDFVEYGKAHGKL